MSKYYVSVPIFKVKHSSVSRCQPIRIQNFYMACNGTLFDIDVFFSFPNNEITDILTKILSELTTSAPESDEKYRLTLIYNTFFKQLVELVSLACIISFTFIFALL